MTIIEKINTIPIEDRIMIVKCYPHGFVKITSEDGIITKDTLRYLEIFNDLSTYIEFPVEDFFNKYGIPKKWDFHGKTQEVSFGDAIIYLLNNIGLIMPGSNLTK